MRMIADHRQKIENDGDGDKMGNGKNDSTDHQPLRCIGVHNRTDEETCSYGDRLITSLSFTSSRSISMTSLNFPAVFRSLPQRKKACGEKADRREVRRLGKGQRFHGETVD